MRPFLKFTERSYRNEKLRNYTIKWDQKKKKKIAQKMKFSVMDFQIRRKLQICAHLLKKSQTKNFIFCAVKHHNAHFQFSCHLIWCQKILCYYKHNSYTIRMPIRENPMAGAKKERFSGKSWHFSKDLCCLRINDYYQDCV